MKQNREAIAADAAVMAVAADEIAKATGTSASHAGNSRSILLPRRTQVAIQQTQTYQQPCCHGHGHCDSCSEGLLKLKSHRRGPSRDGYKQCAVVIRPGVEWHSRRLRNPVRVVESACANLLGRTRSDPKGPHLRFPRIDPNSSFFRFNLIGHGHRKV